MAKSLETAKKNDWKTQSIPTERAELTIRADYSPEDMRRIRRGLVPRDMEDKWFIVYEPDENRLYLHRSWTGHCIYVVDVREADGRFVVTRAIANRNREQYRERDDAYDTRMLLYLIDVLLLGKNSEFPGLEGESPETRALRQWGIIGRAGHPR